MLAFHKFRMIAKSICGPLALAIVLSLGCFISEVGAQVRSGSVNQEDSSLVEAPQVLPITLTAGSSTQNSISTFIVPFSVTDLTGENIIAYYFEITYDPAKINPSGPNFGCTDGALTVAAGPHPTCNVFPGPGRLLISGSGFGTPSGAGVLVNVQFQTTATVGAGDITVITIDPATVAFYKGTGGQAAANPPVNGVITFFGPSAAAASIDGRVATSTGRPVASAQVLLTDRTGVTRVVFSNPFGYFHFDDISIGTTYILGATSKRYTFTSRTVSVEGNLAGLDLIAQP